MSNYMDKYGKNNGRSDKEIEEMNKAVDRLTRGSGMSKKEVAEMLQDAIDRQEAENFRKYYGNI